MSKAYIYKFNYGTVTITTQVLKPYMCRRNLEQRITMKRLIVAVLLFQTSAEGIGDKDPFGTVRKNAD